MIFPDLGINNNRIRERVIFGGRVGKIGVENQKVPMNNFKIQTQKWVFKIRGQGEWIERMNVRDFDLIYVLILFLSNKA